MYGRRADGSLGRFRNNINLNINRKMKKYFVQMAGMLLLLVMAACSRKDDVAKDYIGFEKTLVERTFGKGDGPVELKLKIVAGDKSQQDRKVLVEIGSVPGKAPVVSIVDKMVVIEAGKKSAEVRLKVYPQNIRSRSTVRLVCIPQVKESNRTQMVLKLKSR